MQDFLNALVTHATLISSLATSIMAFVWVFYARLLYRDFKNRYQPRIMIHQAPDTALDSVCMIINIGERTVNVSAIMVVGYVENNAEKVIEITDYRSFSQDEYPQRELPFLLKQGPVGPGNFIDLGSFERILNILQGGSESSANGNATGFPFSEIEIRAVVFSGSSMIPTGAWRKFAVIQSNHGPVKIQPPSLQTYQMTSFWKRRRVKKWLIDLFGSAE